MDIGMDDMVFSGSVRLVMLFAFFGLFKVLVLDRFRHDQNGRYWYVGFDRDFFLVRWWRKMRRQVSARS
jgi:hypothetical protein